MKPTRLFRSVLTAFAVTALAASAPAALVNITNNGTALVGDVSLKALGNNNPSTNFDWLAGQGAFAGKGIVAGYEAITGKDLPVPIFTSYLDASDAATVDITGYSYAVLHYGVGRNGTKGSGGGVVAYFLDQLIGKITFPSAGLGPNGFGGLSSVRLYKGETPRYSVPDSGATWLLLGATLAGLAWIARRRS
jgi:hypothetical protein